ncbi:RNase adapter RapZ [Streptomyces sp. SBT349]|uniref:RapZ C-terminal domain-containing protein n=1 Tax=Streptomyces sp. SBT349 TaxID=1580539 RepID=UPI00066D4EEF
MSLVTITSFGYLHAPPPPAHLTLDLRAHFRDPHVQPVLRELTAVDRAVRDVVLATPGVADLLDAAVGLVNAYLLGPGAGDLTIAVGCAGGRHRAPAVAMAVARALRGHGTPVDLRHRDLHRPVVHR